MKIVVLVIEAVLGISFGILVPVFFRAFSGSSGSREHLFMLFKIGFWFSSVGLVVAVLNLAFSEKMRGEAAVGVLTGVALVLSFKRELRKAPIQTTTANDLHAD